MYYGHSFKKNPRKQHCNNLYIRQEQENNIATP